MSKLKELSIAFDNAENDFEALSIANKIMREQRCEKFGKWYEKLLESDNVISIREDNFKFIINTNDYGIVDFFPKANKTLIRQKNKWIKPGLRWIVKELLKQ
jgi:hypothetical protein